MSKTWDKFGLQWALEEYDQNFSVANNNYKASANLALWLEPIKNGETVMDIGSGTGISTVAMVDSNPDFGRILCLEPAEAIRVAKHKFGRETLFETDNPKKIKAELGVDLSKAYIHLLKATRQRMQNFSGRVDFINSPAQELSDLINRGAIKSGSVDAIYCLSSFHWLANNEAAGKTSPGFVAKSLKGFYDALNYGKILVFNESGLQFNFGMKRVGPEGKEYRDMLINDIHPLQQDFHKRFIENLNEVFGENECSEDALIDPNGKIDAYHFLFDEYSLSKILKENGFGFINLGERKRYDPPSTGVECISYTSPESPYLLTIMPKKDWDRFILTGGNMRYFNHSEELRNMKTEQRAVILRSAYTRASEKYGHLKDTLFGELFATFVAKKH